MHDRVAPEPEPAPRFAWLGEAMRFIVVGLIAFGFDAGVLMLLIELGVSRYAARVVSIGLSIVLTWLLNRRMTFRTTAPPSWREFRGYLLQSLAGAMLSYGVYALVLWLGGSVMLALVIGTGCGSTFNFLRYRVLLGGA